MSWVSESAHLSGQTCRPLLKKHGGFTENRQQPQGKKHWQSLNEYLKQFVRAPLLAADIFSPFTTS